MGPGRAEMPATGGVERGVYRIDAPAANGPVTEFRCSIDSHRDLGDEATTTDRPI
jgi:hypothetical protein